MSHPCSLLKYVLLVLDWVGQSFSIHIHAKHTNSVLLSRYYHGTAINSVTDQHKKLGVLKKTASILFNKTF
jgi:hypothetical protein